MSGVTTFHDALGLHERGYSVFPLGERTKKPLRDFDWKTYTKRRPTLGEIRQWWGFEKELRYNIAVVCGQVSSLVVIDADSREAAVRLYKGLPRTAAMAKTQRGVHFYFQTDSAVDTRIRTLVCGVEADVKAQLSYVVASPSIHPNGHRYEWVYPDWKLKDVPVFDPGWIEEPPPTGSKRLPGSLAGPDVDIWERIARARAYVAKIEPAVSGQGGHNKTMYAAGVLIQKFGLSIQEAWPLMLEYNERCRPRWRERELKHKLESALRATEA